jgi:homoserine kinase type II
MAVKTMFSQQNFTHILAQYDLGNYTQSQPIAQGTVQTNYFLYTTQGKFVLRYYESRSKESVLFESHVLTYLKKQNYPCPNPLQNNKGETVTLYRGKPVVIFEFIEGHSVEQLTKNHKRQVIQKAAELNSLTQAYQPRYKKYRWNYSIELCQTLAKTEANKINTANAYEKLSWFEAQLAMLDLPDSLPKGICHCDFDFSNLLFQNDQLVALLDFDDANYTYLTFDLACLIDSWAWPHQSDALDFGQARTIAQAYTKYRLLSPVEQRHLFDVHKLAILFDGIWFFKRGQANNFYEQRKIEFLGDLGWERYAEELF